MKLNQGNSLKTRQLLTYRNVLIASSMLMIVAAGLFVFIQLHKTEKAMAADCDSEYMLDWSDPTTYAVTCGSINSSSWSVKGLTCNYYSPPMSTGGTPGGPAKAIDISVRINQSGNLDGNDTAWVYLKVNGATVNTYARQGDGSSAVITITQTLVVPAGSTYRVEIKLKNDKTNELWQIKNGNVTACVRTLGVLPIQLSQFTARSTDKDEVLINWSTMSEVNNQYFSIERSSDGIDFKEIHREEGAGNSTSLINYSYTDTNPISSINYYRLRQTDYDGNNTVSNIVKVEVKQKEQKNNAFKVFPNPSTGNISVVFESDKKEPVSIILTTQTGRIISTNVAAADLGINTYKFDLPPNAKPGSYTLRATTKDEVLGSTVVVVK